MVVGDLISQYEILRYRWHEQFRLLGLDAAIMDQEMVRLDAELVGLERLLPDDYRYPGDPE